MALCAILFSSFMRKCYGSLFENILDEKHFLFYSTACPRTGLWMSGFPNAAEEAGTEPLNLHKLIVKSPASTFFMRVDSDSYADMNIYSGDILVIDRSLALRSGDMIVAYLEGEFVIRQYRTDAKGIFLWGGKGVKPQPLTGNETSSIWGVVSHVVHSYRERMYGF